MQKFNALIYSLYSAGDTENHGPLVNGRRRTDARHNTGEKLARAVGKAAEKDVEV